MVPLTDLQTHWTSMPKGIICTILILCVIVIGIHLSILLGACWCCEYHHCCWALGVVRHIIVVVSTHCYHLCVLAIIIFIIVIGHLLQLWASLPLGALAVVMGIIIDVALAAVVDVCIMADFAHCCHLCQCCFCSLLSFMYVGTHYCHLCCLC